MTASARPPVSLTTRRAFRDAGLLVIVVVSVARATGWIFPDAPDLHAYWAAGAVDPYANSHAGAVDAYLYSPAFTQLLEPFRALPYSVVVGLWTAASMFVLWWMAPLLWPVLMLVFVSEISSGNIHLLLAGMVVVGFRYSGVWALALLTKVTLGVGLLWFAVRHEWRSLAIALGTTAVIVGVSFVIAPGLWFEWIRTLIDNARTPAVYPPLVPIPIWVRLPFAVAVVVWGARTDRRWTMPIAVLLATPILWPAAFATLVALLPLTGRETARSVTAAPREPLPVSGAA